MPASRKHPRLKTAVRKTVKWGGIVVTVLLLVVWIASRWWEAGCMTAGGSGVQVLNGALGIASSTGSLTWVGQRIWLERSEPPYLVWWFYSGPFYNGEFVAIPLWLPSLLSLLATAAAWRADAKYLRRARVGMCCDCGYDRAGLAAGWLCPECGAAPSV